MTTRHVPALDGVRGVAILLVMALHTIAFLPARGAWAVPVTLARGGWVGVDVFFVLSGYLITGILLETRGARGWLWSFYVRRALRIWPLSVLLLAALTAVSLGAPALWRADAAWFLREAPWFWLHVVNLRSALWGGIAVDPYGAGTYWSLGVEEQFYLVWPLVVAGIAPRRLAAVALALAVGSAVARVGLAATGASFAVLNMVPVTHADGLGVGAALAALARQGRLPRLAWSGARLVLGYLVLVAALTIAAPGADSSVVQSVGIAGAAVWGAMLVLAARDPSAPRALAAPWLVWVGVRSYALYLLHQPVLFVASRLLRAHWPGVSYGAVIVVSLSATFALAWASWRWWEGPWLRLKRYVPRPVPVGAPSRAAVSHRVRVG